MRAIFIITSLLCLWPRDARSQVLEGQAQEAGRSIALAARALEAGRKDKILGGSEADRGEFPFIAVFRLYGKTFCGGSLVAPHWVLTAAHCMKGFSADMPMEVILGAHDLRDVSGAEVFRAKEVVRHPRAPEYDFALVRLDGESSAAPIDMNRGELRGAVRLTVAGWGRTTEGDPSSKPDILRKVALPLVTREECAAAYAGENAIPVTDAMLCAGYRNLAKGHGKGDSGGPLVLGSGPEAKLAGVVSWHLPGKYGVYSNVSAAATWIDSTIRR